LAASQWTYRSIKVRGATEACIAATSMAWAHTIIAANLSFCPTALLARINGEGSVLLLDSTLGPGLNASAIYTVGTQGGLYLQAVTLLGSPEYAVEGLLRTPEGAAVELVSDSQYVLKGLSEWRAGWERRGFRNSKNEPVANLELWKRLFAIADQRRVKVRWVRGHNGDLLNERADALANEALREAHPARR